MIDVRPWTPSAPLDNTPHVKSAWQLADTSAEQHPLQVRAFYDGETLVAFGGVCAFLQVDGLAFFWQRPGLPLWAFRTILPTARICLWSAHERGMRRISAIVAAMQARAIRFVKALGFSFVGVETGWAGSTEPMLRYSRWWPEFFMPALIAHQLRETELVCQALWSREV